MPTTFNPLRTFFKSLGMAAVSGAIGFFLGVFLTIVSLSIYAAFSKHTPDFTLSYKFVGAPFGVLVFLTIFVWMWFRDLKRV